MCSQIAVDEFEHGLFLRDRLIAGDGSGDDHIATIVEGEQHRPGNCLWQCCWKYPRGERSFRNPEVIAQHLLSPVALGDQPANAGCPGVKIARVRQRVVLSVMRLKPANGGD